MSESHFPRYADKVAHVMGTYGLALEPGVMGRLRDELRASDPVRRHRHAEEDAAIYLARALHAMVIADLCASVGTDAIPGIQDAWQRFIPQVAYRVDRGLINRVLYEHEIQPLMDDLRDMLSPRHLSLSSPLTYHDGGSGWPEAGGDRHGFDIAGAAPGNAHIRCHNRRDPEFSAPTSRGSERRQG